MTALRKKIDKAVEADMKGCEDDNFLRLSLYVIHLYDSFEKWGRYYR